MPVEVDSSTAQSQFDALTAMDLKVLEYSTQGPVSWLEGETGVVLPSRVRDLKKGDSGRDILEVFKDVLLATGSETLVVHDNRIVDDSTRTLSLTESINGIPVIYGVISLEYGNQTRKVAGLVSSFLPNRALPTSPKYSLEDAQKAAAELISAAAKGDPKELEFDDTSYLGYFADSQSVTPPTLAWVLHASLSDGSYEELIVDAMGGLVLRRERLDESLTNTMYDVHGTAVAWPNTPNAYKLTPAQVAASAEARETDDNITLANGFLPSRFPSTAAYFPSVVKTVVSWPYSFPNASALASGGALWLRFGESLADTWWVGKSLGVVTHEYVHGYSNIEVGTHIDPSQNEAGALREGFSDVMATVADVANGNGSGSGSTTWMFGHGLWAGEPDYGIRSLKAPRIDLNAYSSFSQMDWYPNMLMGGFTHENSTILSHAYYLLVQGGVHSRAGQPSFPGFPAVPVIPVVGQGESRARNIFMRAWQSYTMDTEPTFKKMKAAAMSAATSLYPATTATGSTESAFRAVGICGVNTFAPSQMSLVTLGDIMCGGRFYPDWNPVANATRYYGEIGSAALGFALPTPVTDVPAATTSCNFQVNQNSVFRIRACNDCGCGPWSQTYNLTFWQQCP